MISLNIARLRLRENQPWLATSGSITTPPAGRKSKVASFEAGIDWFSAPGRFARKTLQNV